MIRRLLCRWFHQGWSFDGFRCRALVFGRECLTSFDDAHHAGRLREFGGRMELDEDRLLDLEAERHEEWAVAGWSVYVGAQLVPDDTDYSGRRPMGGVLVKSWMKPADRKRATPVPLRKSGAA